MSPNEIIALLPYRKPFHFVDSIESITDDGITGRYTLKTDEYFFEGHFPGNPVTPGVIVTEIMAQIGLVSLGIYLNKDADQSAQFVPYFSSSNVDFLAPSHPSDVLEVTSKKIYYRFKKLKCQVICKNLTSGQEVCRGELSGMITTKA